MTSFYTSSPTVGIPAQPVPDQYFHAAHYRTFQPNTSPSGLFNQTPGSTTSFPPTPSSGCIAGRKRSRGDIEDDNYEPSAPAPSEPPSIPKVEPTYGPGMTVSYPSDNRGHYAVDVDPKPVTDDASDRPIMPSRKSQRTTARGSDDSSLKSLPDLSVRALVDEPFIDEVTRMLGISWVRLDRNEGGLINQRAYTRWIERHYPSLTNIELWFENNSIPGYLGTALNQASGAQEYLLWSFDLKQAVLVTREPSELITKLSLGQPSELIKSAPMSIFANSEPTFESTNSVSSITPPPESQVTTSQPGDMEIDS